MRLSVAITAVPARSAMVNRLIGQLRGTPVDVLWDRDKKGCWWNAERALRTASAKHTHLLLLQDDALLCKDFVATVEAIGAAVPNEWVSLFTTSKKAARAHENGARWVTCDRTWGVANLLPVWMVNDFLKWVAKYPSPSKSSDGRFFAYLLSHERRAWFPMPSVVEHGGAGRSESGHGGFVQLRAGAFIGADVSGTSIDWTAGLQDVPHVSTGTKDATFYNTYVK